MAFHRTGGECRPLERTAALCKMRWAEPFILHESRLRSPASLAEAAAEVGATLALPLDWLNVGPAGLITFGLPAGLEQRVQVRRYGGLEVHLPSVDDLICFKLYATVDLTENSRHFQDLQAIGPTDEQLLNAARWTRTHDPSKGFLGELIRILRLFDLEVNDDDLAIP